MNAFYVKDRLLVVAELEIRPDTKMVGRSVRELRREDNVFVVSHERNGTVDFYPGGDIQIQAGDLVTMQTEPGMLRKVHDWNGGPAD